MYGNTVSTKKRKNIPVFIPHLGCPNTCVFCNQRSISGTREFDREGVRAYIEESISTLPDGSDAEIAFFGGSFTGIDRELMIYLLDLAEDFVKCDYSRDITVSGIRMSTRPDYISDEILDLLDAYSVKAIELGLQSMDDGVLLASKRGHTSLDAERACRMIKSRGKYELVGQMMIGLPHSTPKSEMESARKIIELGADAVRVYPTVVFFGTELCEMAKAGDYAPLSTQEAVERSARVIELFMNVGVKVLRIGLCASENLSSDEQVYGGANHAALGELVMSELYRERMENAIREKLNGEKRVVFVFDPSEISKATGQHRSNINYLTERFGLDGVRVCASVKESAENDGTLVISMKI